MCFFFVGCSSVHLSVPSFEFDLSFLSLFFSLLRFVVGTAVVSIICYVYIFLKISTVHMYIYWASTQLFIRRSSAYWTEFVWSLFFAWSYFFSLFFFCNFCCGSLVRIPCLRCVCLSIDIRSIRKNCVFIVPRYMFNCGFFINICNFILHRILFLFLFQHFTFQDILTSILFFFSFCSPASTAHKITHSTR